MGGQTKKMRKDDIEKGRRPVGALAQEEIGIKTRILSE